MSAYWRYARWQVESRLKRDVQFDWISGSKLIVSSGMTGATGNIYCGLHEFADMGFLMHLLRPGDLFVDVGANVGSYTVLASSVCRARSIAFEPDPGTASALRRNVEANDIGELAHVCEMAVGSATGDVSLTVGQDTTNHVVIGGTDKQTQKVLVACLDDVLRAEDPVLIKIDVEGYEPEVMAGAAQTLKKSSLSAVIIETVNDKIRDAFVSAGFIAASYDPFSREIVCGYQMLQKNSSNTLFVRPDMVADRVRSAVSRLVAGIPV